MADLGAAGASTTGAVESEISALDAAALVGAFAVGVGAVSGTGAVGSGGAGAGGAGAAGAAAGVASALSAALNGCRPRFSSVMAARMHQGSRIASPIPCNAPETMYIRMERVPMWMSPASVMPGIRRKPSGTFRRSTLVSAMRAL
jgi:hypothetical protein